MPFDNDDGRTDQGSACVLEAGLPQTLLTTA